MSWSTREALSTFPWTWFLAWSSPTFPDTEQNLRRRELPLRGIVSQTLLLRKIWKGNSICRRLPSAFYFDQRKVHYSELQHRLGHSETGARKGCVRKSVDITRTIGLPYLPQLYQWLPLHRCPSSLAQKTSLNQLGAFAWRASHLSLPHGHRTGTVALIVNCWECWVVRGQLTQKHNYQYENEKAWLVRVDDAQGSPSLAYWITFPTHIPKIEALVNRPCVKTSDSALLCETAVCFLHIHEIVTSGSDPNTHNTPPDVDLDFRKSPADEASWKKQVWNLHCCFSHDRNACSFRFDWCNWSTSATFCQKLCSILSLIIPKCSLATVNLIVQFLAISSIAGQLEHIPQRALPLFHNLPTVSVIIYAWCCHSLERRHIFLW